MRVLALVAVFSSHMVLAQPTCPYDAKVRALADDPTSLEMISKAMQRQQQLKRWLESNRSVCKQVETKVRVLRTLDSLSQRCASALVEFQIHESECREISIYNDGGPPRFFALVTPDAKGKLQVAWQFARETERLPPPKALVEPLRVECAHAIGTGDGGSSSLLAIANDSSFRFDGCTLQGVPEALVRREVTAMLERSDSARVSCRFFEADAGRPTCGVTTNLTEEGVAVVHSGGFETVLYPADPPRFTPSSAYFELTDGGAQWLCNDLELAPESLECAPLDAPSAARQGCTPPAAKQALLRRASFAECPSAREQVWRREVPLPPSTGAALKLGRLVVDSGQGVLNEDLLATRVRDGVEALARCTKSPARYDNAVGTVLVSAFGGVSSWFPAEADDEACSKLLRDALAPNLKVPRRASPSFYRYRVVLSPQ